MTEKDKIDFSLKGIGKGIIISSKDGDWILLKGDASKKRYEEALKTGREFEIYGIEKRKDIIESHDEDTLFAFKE